MYSTQTGSAVRFSAELTGLLAHQTPSLKLQPVALMYRLCAHRIRGTCPALHERWKLEEGRAVGGVERWDRKRLLAPKERCHFCIIVV